MKLIITESLISLVDNEEVLEVVPTECYANSSVQSKVGVKGKSAEDATVKHESSHSKSQENISDIQGNHYLSVIL